MSETRRTIDKIKMAVPAALLGLGTTACAAESEDSRVHASATVLECSTEQIGGSDTGWTHGAAQRAINNSLDSSANKINFSGLNVPPSQTSEAITSLPVYDRATEAVKLTGGEIADEGDKLEVCVEVSADSDSNADVKVQSATIIDLPNNQK